MLSKFNKILFQLAAVIVILHSIVFHQHDEVKSVNIQISETKTTTNILNFLKDAFKFNPSSDHHLQNLEVNKHYFKIISLKNEVDLISSNFALFAFSIYLFSEGFIHFYTIKDYLIIKPYNQFAFHFNRILSYYFANISFRGPPCFTNFSIIINI